jgi:hypothetical protein
MENWQKQRRTYREQGRLTDKRHEDLLAVRILRGLGVTDHQKGIYKLERGLLGAEHGDLPLWDRTKAVFDRLLCTRSLPCDWMNRRWLIEPYLIKNDREMLERIGLDEWVDQSPMFFARVGLSPICKAFVLVEPTELRNFTPPFAVLDYPAKADMRLVVQEAQHFVEQFGPFDWGGIL